MSKVPVSCISARAVTHSEHSKGKNKSISKQSDEQTAEGQQAEPYTYPAESSNAALTKDPEPNADNKMGNFKRRWIIMLIPFKRHGRKAFHIPVPSSRPDADLFNDLRSVYYRHKSLWSRIKGLRTVTGIHVARVRMLCLFSLPVLIASLVLPHDEGTCQSAGNRRLAY